MTRQFRVSCTLIAILYASTAPAADLPSRSPPPIAYLQTFTWTGLYFGGNVGFGGDRFVYPFNAAAPALGIAAGGSASVTSSGVIGGGQVGFNWQLPNNFILGVETDFDGAAIRGKVTADVNGLVGVPVGAAAQLGSKIDYIGTVRGRVGYAWDRLLVYATGGFAYGQVSSSISAAAGIGPIGASFAASQNSMRAGWSIGGGFEYALNGYFSVKTEYLYADLGTNSIFNSTIIGASGVQIRQSTTANIVRAGFNYKFPWGAPQPVVARY